MTLIASPPMANGITKVASAGVAPLSRGVHSLSSAPSSTGWADTEITAEISGDANVRKFKAVQRDFRSDTLTIQTDAQMIAALRASRGDDMYQEDESTRAFEARVAKMAGKEAALFAITGTMTNQLAIRAHLQSPPHSIICDHRAHVHKEETGAIAVFTQATTHQLFPSNKRHLTARDVSRALELNTANIHRAPTKLITLENTMSGMIFPQEEVVKISELARSHGIGMHLDGARLWNVLAERMDREGKDARDEEAKREVLTSLLEPFDTASLCMSKGLGAPIGSVVVGPAAMIERMRHIRKMLGGGVRQIGLCSAQADYALTHHFPRLAGTHRLAKRLEEGLRALGCGILAPVDTSMVFFDVEPLGIDMTQLQARLAGLPNPIHTFSLARLVLHHQTHPQAVEDLIDTVRAMKEEVERNGGPKRVVRDEDEEEWRKYSALGY